MDTPARAAAAAAETCEAFFDFSPAANVCTTGQPGSALAETEAPCNGENSASERGQECAGTVTCGNCRQVTGPAPISVFSPQQDWPSVEFCSAIRGSSSSGRCAGTGGFVRCPNGDSDCVVGGEGLGAFGEDYCIVPCATCDVQSCCDYMLNRFPTATPAQFPELPVNPAPYAPGQSKLALAGFLTDGTRGLRLAGFIVWSRA